MTSLTNPLSLVSYSNTDQSMGKIGLGERSGKVRITYANGMNTRADQCATQAMKISNTHGFNNVHFVYDPTEGILKDIYVACKMLWFGAQTESVQKLTQLWQSLFVEMGGAANSDSRIIHYAYSRGGIVTELALKNLTQEERSKMIIHSYGSPAIIDENEI